MVDWEQDEAGGISFGGDSQSESLTPRKSEHEAFHRKPHSTTPSTKRTDLFLSPALANYPIGGTDGIQPLHSFPAFPDQLAVGQLQLQVSSPPPSAALLMSASSASEERHGSPLDEISQSDSSEKDLVEEEEEEEEVEEEKEEEEEHDKQEWCHLQKAGENSVREVNEERMAIDTDATANEREESEIAHGEVLDEDDETKETRGREVGVQEASQREREREKEREKERQKQKQREKQGVTDKETIEEEQEREEDREASLGDALASPSERQKRGRGDEEVEEEGPLAKKARSSQENRSETVNSEDRSIFEAILEMVAKVRSAQDAERSKVQSAIASLEQDRGRLENEAKELRNKLVETELKYRELERILTGQPHSLKGLKLDRKTNIDPIVANLQNNEKAIAQVTESTTKATELLRMIDQVREKFGQGLKEILAEGKLQSQRLLETLEVTGDCIAPS